MKKNETLIQKERVSKYYEKKIKGKPSQSDILISMKEDFNAFAEKKGGLLKRFRK